MNNLVNTRPRNRFTAFVGILGLAGIFLTACNKNDDDQYGEIVAPIITAFSPQEVLPGGEITIEGSGFKGVGNTVVRFPGNMLGRIIEASASQLRVAVPREAETGQVTVRTGVNNYAISAQELVILPYPAPILEHISILQGPKTAPVMIEGQFLSEALTVSSKPEVLEKTKVLFGDVAAQVDSVSSTQVWFKVPELPDFGPVPVYVVREGKKSDPLEFSVEQYLHFEDEFDREETDWIGQGSSPGIGNYWDIMDGQWKISRLEGSAFLESTRGGAGLPVIVNASAKTQVDADNDFTVSGKIQVPGTARSTFCGLAFHVQDAMNYYVLRINGAGNVQLLRVIEGAPRALYNDGSQAVELQGGSYYNLEVSAESSYVFSFKISNTNGEEILSASVSDPQEQFNGGFGGFYATSPGLFDDFLLRSSTP